MTTPIADPTDSPARRAVPLDEVMLAMDVVDTLRHQSSLVAAELDEESRARELTQRLQDIYSSQGIEVPAAVIAEGVRALAQDRFKYDPPERTFAVRLAEIYVDRGKWAKRALIAGLLLGALWLAVAIPTALSRRSQIAAFRARLAEVAVQLGDTASEADRLAAALDSARAVAAGPGTAALLDDAGAGLQRARTQLEAIQDEQRRGPEPDDYPDRTEELDRTVNARRKALAAVTGDLGAVRGQLQAVGRLRSASAAADRAMARLQGIALEPADRAELQRLRTVLDSAIAASDAGAAQSALQALESAVDARLAAHRLRSSITGALQQAGARLSGVDVEPDAQRELESLSASVTAKLAAGDLPGAKQDAERLEALVATLDQSYELRIVSQPGEQSGVWRYPAGRRDTRNYYIVVEAIGDDGQPLTLPITSEEDRTTRKVRRFAIRVPEAVYESVKADKLDNGIVDRNVFGSKRRGARAPRYAFDVAGGMITDW